MKIKKYLKEKGLKRALQVLWLYKAEIVLEKMFLLFFKSKPLKNTIVIESHNDFDCNGGAFYDYLINHKYNEKYRIVWLVRRKVKHKLPKNVTTVPLYGPSFRKAYYMCNYKYMLYDCEGGHKMRDEQILVYCSHGAGGLKAIKGKMFIPDDVDYILTLSNRYKPIQAEQWSLSAGDPRLVSIGYPSHDILFRKFNELDKITNVKYEKVFLWMPTFRKGIAFNRNDSSRAQRFGLPIIETTKQYRRLNDTLKGLNALMIIKIHPKQDLSTLKLPDLSNIKILTGDDVKRLGIDNYRLMTNVDAMISDYSGAIYDFLQRDLPIGYVLEDMAHYKSGFVVEDIRELVAGAEIYNIDELVGFIEDVCDNIDRYVDKRRKVRGYIHEFSDGQACKRLARLLDI